MSELDDRKQETQAKYMTSNMMDLTTTDGIKKFYDEVFVPKKERLADWKSGYLKLVKEVADASQEEIAQQAMQLDLWEDKSISGSGMCSIPM